MTASLEQELALVRQKLETIESKIAVSSDRCDCETTNQTSTENHVGEISGQTGLAAMLALPNTGRASIDSNTSNDNGFLSCMRAVWGHFSNFTVFSHSTTAIAFSNIRGGPQGYSLICGHGAPGEIVTGTGQVLDGTDKYMSAGNESFWRPIASQGITGGQLTLFGCEVAAGTQGTDFLRRVASAVRKPVGAWTGDVFCGGGRCWGTGSFVVIQPGMRVEVVEAPDMFEERDRSRVFRLASHEGYEEVHFDQIKSLNYTPIGSQSDRHTVLTIERDDAVRVLEMINFDNPLITDDKPGAILTGLFSITYSTPAGDKIRSFRVLRYALLQDALFQNYYYYTSIDFKRLLLRQ